MVSARRSSYRAYDPRRGEPVGHLYESSTAAEVDEAAEAAAAAFDSLRAWSGRRMAAALDAIAAELERERERLVEAADLETALGQVRLGGELTRTVVQFRSFARMCEEGSYVEAIVDHARPDAVPPIPDLRRMLIPLGPVAVFGASNFPLAFSVPGGDTASALAARCPVVVKAHPAHPRTSELAASAIARALASVEAPSGTFALVHGPGPEVGAALVQAAAIQAVAFTGSTAGGRALYDLAARRPNPIPVYAEMGSVNPFVVTERALVDRGPEIAAGFATSLTQGSGQFCTKPGVALVPDTPAGRAWCRKVAEAVAAIDLGPLLTAGIRSAFEARVAASLGADEVEMLAQPQPAPGTGFAVGSTVITTTAAMFLRTPALAEEHFGPFGAIVRYGTISELLEVHAALGGNLTATVHAEPEDAATLGPVLAALEKGAGRVIWNGYPTGVAVTGAMQHGGPYPASTSSIHTSVGTTSVRRFLRPVAYQGLPPELLPAELRDENPLGILRLVDGEFTRDPTVL